MNGVGIVKMYIRAPSGAPGFIIQTGGHGREPTKSGNVVPVAIRGQANRKQYRNKKTLILFVQTGGQKREPNNTSVFLPVATREQTDRPNIPKQKCQEFIPPDGWPGRRTNQTKTSGGRFGNRYMGDKQKTQNCRNNKYTEFISPDGGPKRRTEQQTSGHRSTDRHKGTSDETNQKYKFEKRQ